MWLFVDFDNTLMATEVHGIPLFIQRFNECYAQKIGRELTLAEFKQNFHGQARQGLCMSLSAHFGIEVDYQKLYIGRETRVMEHYKSLPEGVYMAPHAIEALTELSKNGAILSVVTNNPIQRAFAAMRFANNQRGEELSRLFTHRYFEAGEVQKPNPDVYLRAISQVSADVAKSYAIEDSVTGAKAAQAAGLRVIGYVGLADDPVALKQKLLAAGCVEVFEDWKECPSLRA